MVQEGFYSNRTDFIRTAIRNQLERHADVVRQSTARKSLDLGLRNYTREDLEAARRAGEMLQINVLGLATIAQDVTPELARATIVSVSVLGALHATRQGRSRRQNEVNDAESRHGPRSHAPHPCRPTGRSHRPAAAHASGRQRPRRLAAALRLRSRGSSRQPSMPRPRSSRRGKAGRRRLAPSKDANATRRSMA